MLELDLALTLTTGMVFTVNPCGFAMLPAYLSFFLGREDREADASLAAGMRRALAVTAAVTAGFVVALSVLALTIKGVTDQIYDLAPWVTVPIGLALAGVGVVLLSGRSVMLRIPHLDRGGRDRSLASMVVFGVSYVVASLGCTMPLFLPVATFNFDKGFLEGVAYVVVFAAGFFLVIGGLTVAMAVARDSLVHRVRSVLPHVNRIAGTLLVLSGLYVAWYGLFEIRDPSESDVAVDEVTGWSGDVSTWLQQHRATVGWALTVVIATAVAVVVFGRRRSARRETVAGSV